jgi:hypothetical protein
MTEPNRITPADIESKFREIQHQVDRVAAEGKQRLLPVAVAAAGVLVLVVYLLGRRSGKRKRTVVQIRRL